MDAATALPAPGAPRRRLPLAAPERHLLVLGGSILLGGLGREKQVFDRAAAAAGATLLALAAVGLVVPAVFHLVADAAVRGAVVTPERETASEHSLSLLIAIVLFVAYL